MVRDVGRECCIGTDVGSDGGGWIGKSSYGFNIRVEVLWRMGNNCFNPFLCSGDLKGTIHLYSQTMTQT